MSTDQVELDYYQVLEVAPTASSAEIQASFRRLAKQKHPDKLPGNPLATAIFQRLNHAYSVLKDPKARTEYDIARGIRLPVQPVPRRTHRSRFTFNVFHAGSSWSSSFDTGRGPPSAQNQRPVNPLDGEIQGLRRQLREDEASISNTRRRCQESQQEIDRLHEAYAATRDECKEFGSRIAFLEKNYGPMGSIGVNGLATGISRAGKRRIELEDTLKSLERKMDMLRGKIDGEREFLQRQVAAIKKRQENVHRLRQRLDELGKAWRANEFHGGKEMEDPGWDGWNGWCGWDNKEEELTKEEQEREEEQRKQRPWWVKEEEATFHAEASPSGPQKEDRSTTDHEQGDWEWRNLWSDDAAKNDTAATEVATEAATTEETATKAQPTAAPTAPASPANSTEGRAATDSSDASDVGGVSLADSSSDLLK